MTVENAAASIERLAAEGVSARVIDLNLDDIFAAYVAGHREPPGRTSACGTIAVTA